MLYSRVIISVLYILNIQVNILDNAYLPTYLTIQAIRRYVATRDRDRDRDRNEMRNRKREIGRKIGREIDTYTYMNISIYEN